MSDIKPQSKQICPLSEKVCCLTFPLYLQPPQKKKTNLPISFFYFEAQCTNELWIVSTSVFSHALAISGSPFCGFAFQFLSFSLSAVQNDQTKKKSSNYSHQKILLYNSISLNNICGKIIVPLKIIFSQGINMRLHKCKILFVPLPIETNSRPEGIKGRHIYLIRVDILDRMLGFYLATHPIAQTCQKNMRDCCHMQ